MDKIDKQAVYFLEDNLEANGCAETNNLKEGDEITYEQFALYRQCVYDIVITAWSIVPYGHALVPVETLESIRDSSTDPNHRDSATSALALAASRFHYAQKYWEAMLSDMSQEHGDG